MWDSNVSWWVHSNFSSAFRPKSTLTSLPLFQLPKRESRSPCLRLSIEVISWLDSVIRFSPSRAQPIVRSFNPIGTANNYRSYILMKLVSVDWSVAMMDICIAVFLQNGVVNDIDHSSILLIQVRNFFSVTALIFLLAAYSIVFLTSTVLLAIYSILLLTICSILFLTTIFLFSSFYSKGTLQSSWRYSWQYFSLPVFSSVGLYYHNVHKII